MTTAPNVPYEWTEIEIQVREAIIAMASILERFGPEDEDTVMAFLGQKVDIAEASWISVEELAMIDITRHALYTLAFSSYCYTYQLEGWEKYTVEVLHETSCGLFHGGYCFTDSESKPTGLSPTVDAPLRRVFETAVARWNWTHEDSELTVRELALLSNMVEPTVRSTLSKEGFKLARPGRSDDNKSLYTLSYSESLQWLSRRRGFIPNVTALSSDRNTIVISETLADKTVPFPIGVKRMVELAGVAAEIKANVEHDWYAGLIEGRPVLPDVQALIAIADALDLPRSAFAPRGVEHLLEIAVL